MNNVQHAPGPWSVFDRQAKGSTATVYLVTRGTECFRQPGGATFRKRASTFRSAEAAQRIANRLNAEIAAAKPTPYYREAPRNAHGLKEMLPMYEQWLSCANEALANGCQFTRLVWGR